MKLLYISTYQFKKFNNGTYALPAYGDKFWTKYLDVFDSVYVLGEFVKPYLDNGTLIKLSNSKVSVEILPGNTHPKDFVNDGIIHKKLDEKIKNADAILIKPTTRKGMMAIKLAEKYNKPYMVELTGDLKLTLSTHKSILRRLYGPFIHNRSVKAIKNAMFGLYVTEKHLQKVYPIKGKQCGVSDVVIDEILEEVLSKRIEKIQAICMDDEFNVGLIGSYHDTRKGIDTAIEAMSVVRKSDVKMNLNILALGTEDDRRKWIEYAEKYGVSEYIKFPPSCDTTQKVLEWIDTQDINILPSRSEGLPRCIVEAMSRACPCITSNVCGMPELINKKWLHNPSDANALAELIIKMHDKDEMLITAKENFENSYRFLRETINVKRNKFLEEFKNYCIEKNKENE